MTMEFEAVHADVRVCRARGTGVLVARRSGLYCLLVSDKVIQSGNW